MAPDAAENFSVFLSSICCGTPPGVTKGSYGDVQSLSGGDEALRDDPVTHLGVIGGDLSR
jgi:hypothetical protein